MVDPTTVNEQEIDFMTSDMSQLKSAAEQQRSVDSIFLCEGENKSGAVIVRLLPALS